MANLDPAYGKGSGGGGGSTTFKELTDTPASYTGQAGKVPAVNQAESGLEYIDGGVQVQSDFLETDTMSPAYILNRNRNALEKTTGPLTAGAIIVADVGGLLEESSISEDATDLTATKPININGENVLTEPDFVQRQVIRSGLVSNIVVASLLGDTQISITPVDATFKAYFNSDEEIDSRGTIIEVGTSFQNVPVDAVARKYYVFLLVGGNLGVGTSKTESSDLTRIHICEYIAAGGVLVPETLITNPFLTWTDKTIQGILDTDGIRIDDLRVFSPDNGSLELETTDFDILGNSINYAVSKVNPHIKKALGSNPLAWTYVSQTETSIPPVGADTLVNSAQWDDNGVDTAVPINNATVQRLLVASDGDFIAQLGQSTFANYDDALLNVDNITFALPPVLFDAVEVARIVVKQGATDTADTDEITILNSSGEAGGGSGTPAQTSTFFDTDFTLENSVDPTKRARFDCVNLQPASLNTFKFPAGEGTLALEEDRDYAIVTTSKLLTKDDVLEMVDSSGGDISITLPSNPEDGQRHVFWIKDNTNVIDVISTDPGAPIGEPVTVQPTRLQGQWVLGADFTDSSGNGRDLAQVGVGGGFISSTILGRSVQMYDTEGTSSFVATGYKGVLGGNPKTVTMWFSHNGIVPPLDEGYFIQWGLDSTGTPYWGIQWREDQNQIRAEARTAWRGWATTRPEIVTLFDGNPHHIAVTVSGSNTNSQRLYIDGVEITFTAQDTFPAMDIKSGADVTLFNSIQAAKIPSIIDGAFYDVRMWDVALSALEVETVRTENLGGGVNIAALDENTIVEFAFDGTQWLAADAIFERILDLYQHVAGLATVARTGDYDDLINKPENFGFEGESVIAENTTQWYRITSTPDLTSANISAEFEVSSNEGSRNQNSRFQITLFDRDENQAPSFNLLSSHRTGTGTTIDAVRLVADQGSIASGAYHVEVRIGNDLVDGDASFVVYNRGTLDNQTPVNFTVQPDIPIRVAGQWQVGTHQMNMSEALTITEDGFVNYGIFQESVPKINASHLPFSFFSNQQNNAQFTRNANAVVTIGSTISDGSITGSGLVQWLHNGAGNGSLKTSYNDTIGPDTILDLVQVGSNIHEFRLVKDGWYECTLQVNLDDGNDNLAYTATLIRMDSSNEILEVLGIAEHEDLGRQCAYFKWSGFYNDGDKFALLKTAGSGVNDDLRGRNPRFEIKWVGVV